MFAKQIVSAAVTLLALCLVAFTALADTHCDFADEEIRFGGVVPLSAPGSVTGGIGMDWGFQQAVADINADCGIQINGVNHRLRVITVDSEGRFRIWPAGSSSG